MSAPLTGHHLALCLLQYSAQIHDCTLSPKHLTIFNRNIIPQHMKFAALFTKTVFLVYIVRNNYPADYYNY